MAPPLISGRIWAAILIMAIVGGLVWFNGGALREAICGQDPYEVPDGCVPGWMYCIGQEDHWGRELARGIGCDAWLQGW